MPHRWVRATVNLSAAALLVLVAACSTAPTAPPGRGGAATPSKPASPAAPSTTPGAATDEVPPALAPDVASRPQLLAGEVPREFQRGQASWYGPRFNGRRTASGERFDMQELTAAHRTLPFGTLVRVHSLVNGRDVDVRVTDRGPYSGNRIIDLSRAAAEELGMLGMGLKEVVLLVPESTPEVATTPAPATRKRPPARRRSAPARTPR
ncbi:MAG: septal ring lytic transglycosylase RlpA family protein [Polaromonas sp.]|uniref:septal ring lytic transglycosylase RlpA family protein n=1 Tax=Polaromonas sp. TaxID=1869339 RepID=UPI003264DEBB